MRYISMTRGGNSLAPHSLFYFHQFEPFSLPSYLDVSQTPSPMHVSETPSTCPSVPFDYPVSLLTHHTSYSSVTHLHRTRENAGCLHHSLPRHMSCILAHC